MIDISKLKAGDIILNVNTLMMRLIDDIDGELVAVGCDGYHSLEEIKTENWFVCGGGLNNG